MAYPFRSTSARPNRRNTVIAAVSLLVCASVVATGQLAAAASGADPEPAVTAAPAPVDATHPSDSDDPSVMGRYPAEEYVQDAAALPAALVDSLERDLGLAPEEYLAEAAAATDAVQVVAALEQQGVDITSSRLEGTTLVVSVESAQHAELAASAGAVVEPLAAADVDLDALDFVPAFDLSGGDGYGWSTGAKANSQCSIGLTGFRVSDGRPVALTAGHCVAGMAGITGPVKQLTQSAPGASGSYGQAIGSPGDSRFGGGFDGGLIVVDGAQAVPRANVLTWGGGAGAPRSSAPLAVTDQSAAIVGASLCKSGSRTGWTCGTVKSVDRTVDVGGNQVNSILATTCIQPGDSGGPALMGTTAVGVNSSTSSVPCGDASYISAFFPLISAAGRASVATQFAGVWEPAFTVSAPSVGAVTVGASGAATSVSGTVAHSSGSVAVYVDGAATPAVSAPIQSGQWTVDAAALASRVADGSHRIVVVTQLGVWSRSAQGAEATLVTGGSPKQVTGGLLPADYVTR